MKVTHAAHSNDEQWVADAPRGYINNVGELEATQLQLDEDDLVTAQALLAQRNEFSNVAAYVADAPKDYPAVASKSWEREGLDDDEAVQTRGVTDYCDLVEGDKKGKCSYIGQLDGEDDDLDHIKDSHTYFTNDEDYVEDAPHTNPEVIAYDGAN